MPSARPVSPSLERTIALAPPPGDRTEWSLPYTVLSELDCPRPSRASKKLDTEVRNGDCLPACFCAALEYLNQGGVLSTSLVAPAARLRADLTRWIKDRWMSYPFYNSDMTVHEIVHLHHSLGVTGEERKVNRDWGSTPAERMDAYEACCDSLYFSDAEMLLFACWLWEKRGLAFMFRVYRGDSPTHIVDTPSPETLRMMGCTRAIVVELHHTGELDSRAAHYRLIEGGSLGTLARAFSPRAAPVNVAKKRKRPALLNRGRLR